MAAAGTGSATSTFDLWINGPLDQPLLDGIRAIDPAARYAAVADVAPRYLEAGGRRALVSNGRFFVDPEGIGLMYPGGLRLSGKPFGEIAGGEVIIDGATADAIGVRPGDQALASVIDGNGREVKLPLSIGSIVVTTSHLRSSIGGILTDDWRIAIPADISPFSSMFVVTADPSAFEARVGALKGELQVVRRSDLLNEAMAQANQLVDRARELAFLVLAVGVLLVFVVRDVRDLLRLRSRAAAVLIALGLRPATIARAVIVEQLALLALSITLGTIAGVAWFIVGFHLPVPVADLGFLIVTMVMVSAASLLAIVGLVTRQSSSIPVTRLLFEGA